MGNIWLPSQSDLALALREPNLLIPGRKPVGPVEIDWSHPLTRNLTRCYIAIGNNLFDLVTRTFATRVGATETRITQNGQGAYTTGGTSGYFDTGYRIPAGQYSFGFGGKIERLDGSNRFFGIGQNAVGAAGYDLGGMYFSSTSPHVCYFFPRNGANLASTATFTQGEYLRYLAVYNTATSDARQYTNKGVNSSSITGAHGTSYNFVIGARWNSIVDQFSVETTALIVPIWTRALTDAESRYWVDDQFCFLNPANDTPFLFQVAAGGGITQAITSVTETDAAQALTASKSRALTLATETGEAQALGRAKRKLIEPALETDTAQPVSFLGQIVQAITPALEAETAVALGKAKAKAIGIATETDEAITVIFSGAKAIEPALETGEAVALGKSKRKAISPALETDEALPVSLTLAVALSAALETDTALALGKAKRKAIEPAVESDTAVAVTLFRETTLVQADIDAIADAVYTKLVSEGLVQKLLELWQLQGLDIANPMTVTPTTRQVDAISLALTGDGVTTTTVTRQ